MVACQPRMSRLQAAAAAMLPARWYQVSRSSQAAASTTNPTLPTSTGPGRKIKASRLASRPVTAMRSHRGRVARTRCSIAGRLSPVAGGGGMFKPRRVCSARACRRADRRARSPSRRPTRAAPDGVSGSVVGVGMAAPWVAVLRGRAGLVVMVGSSRDTRRSQTAGGTGRVARCAARCGLFGPPDGFEREFDPVGWSPDGPERIPTLATASWGREASHPPGCASHGWWRCQRRGRWGRCQHVSPPHPL